MHTRAFVGVCLGVCLGVHMHGPYFSTVTLPSPPSPLIHRRWMYVSSQGYENNILRYYVDGEKEASVAFPFGLGHGSTMVDNDGPWSAGSVFGKTGEPSGTHTYIYKLTSNNRM